jgi:hypothetical protein
MIVKGATVPAELTGQAFEEAYPTTVVLATPTGTMTEELWLTVLQTLAAQLNLSVRNPSTWRLDGLRAHLTEKSRRFMAAHGMRGNYERIHTSPWAQGGDHGLHAQVDRALQQALREEREVQLKACRAHKRVEELTMSVGRMGQMVSGSCRATESPRLLDETFAGTGRPRAARLNGGCWSVKTFKDAVRLDCIPPVFDPYLLELFDYVLNILGVPGGPVHAWSHPGLLAMPNHHEGESVPGLNPDWAPPPSTKPPWDQPEPMAPWQEQSLSHTQKRDLTTRAEGRAVPFRKVRRRDMGGDILESRDAALGGSDDSDGSEE